MTEVLVFRQTGSFIPVAASLVLSGCLASGSDGPTVTERLDATLGQSDREVITRWGIPDDTVDFADGGQLMTWRDDEFYDLPVDAHLECEITLETSPQGTVTDWSADYNGPGVCHDIMDGQG